jgi:energy-coupling factor transporter ATP-binding protein EcfA2
MQIIGVYLKSGKQNVCKCLQPGWYPFGNFPNCHDALLNNNLDKIRKEIKEHQLFINHLYGLALDNKKSDIPLSVNCIVGKNGTGKSTLINLLYRIINNFSVKFHDTFKSFENSFEPVWSNGFEAELYYECSGKIGCIISEQKFSEYIPVKVFFGDKYDLFEKQMKNEQVIQFIYDSFFYTIATDYSLYSSSELEEDWKPILYHKNDGYQTPIVLLPFRDSNNIDINKEKELANERIETLSLLMGICDNEFIKGYQPHSIQYRLKGLRNNRVFFRRKVEEFYRPYSFKTSQKEFKLKCEFFITTLSSLWSLKIGQNNKNPTVMESGLTYLSYKTIKTCINYDIYKKFNIFKYLEKLYEYNKDNENSFFDDNSESNKKISKEKNKLNEIIEKFLSIKDHTTKKIRHTYYFLTNDVYMGASQIDGIIKADQFINLHKDKRNTYYEIEEDLLPPIYNTTFYLKKSSGKDKIKLDSLSSGELQFINSLSYIIYHLVNLHSVNADKGRIKHKNISLIFDETEIYYHPEYQREFIYKLINLLNNCGFFEYFSFNLTIITHSPFMVSDIPSDSILRLLDINKTIETGKTFSANIYDLLKHQFYLNAPVGGVSEQIYNKIIRDYKNNNFFEYSENMSFYKQLLAEIGDDYFKKSMKVYISFLEGSNNEKN